MCSTIALNLDLLSVQTTLSELEERFSLLHDETEDILGSLLAEQAKEKSEAHKRIQELMQQISAKSTELETERKKRLAAEQAVHELKEEAELTLLQLHQVQQELEHFFAQSCEKDKLIKRFKDQQQRVKILISKALIKNAHQIS